MNSKMISIATFVIVFIITVTNCEATIGAIIREHYCTTFEIIPKTETKLKTYTEEITFKGLCKVDGRFRSCIKKNSTIKSRIETYDLSDTVQVLKCCDGYAKDIDQQCQPVCESPCENGFCSGPNQCKCNIGYELIEINGTQRCQPICKNCENGECIAPNVCKCAENYQWQSDTETDMNEVENATCKPICKSNCKNGQRKSPDNCVCNTNYYFNKTLDECLPVCNMECIFGECIAPGLCECANGFHFKFDSTNECEADCEQNCGNDESVSRSSSSTSTSINTSTSDNEYDLDYQTELSLNESEWDMNELVSTSESDLGTISNCNCTSNLVNGRCTAAGNFECFQGFQFSNGHDCICEPIELVPPNDETPDLMKVATFDESSPLKWKIVILLLVIVAAICMTVITLLVQRSKRTNYYLETVPKNVVHFRNCEQVEMK